MAIELVMPFSHLILCCPLLLLPSICPSIRVHILHDLSAPQELSSMRALLRVNRQCPNIPCLAETVNNSAMQDRFGRQNEPFGYVFANLDCKSNFQFSSVQLLSHVQLCHSTYCSRPGFPVHHQLPVLLKLMSTDQ